MTGRRKIIKNTDETRPSTSLPLFYRNSESCDIGLRTGMECMPLRSPPGPYHYHVNDQTKSLQELQNEVGALLEFRDLVIETFPDLKNKMASSSSASSTLTGMQSSSLASRREWEPGIRVRRKLMQKENSEISSSSLIRSRSNSHSGKKEPKSGEGNGSVVQDSGFSTETSSSKETHSASSTSGTVTTQTVLMSTTSRIPAIDAEDELWNLLDVIHRKSARLREEVEYLQNIEKEQSRTNSIPPSFLSQLERLSKDDVQILRKERDRLLDKLAEMEAETISSRIKASQAEEKLDAMSLAKREIEEQLKIALSQKVELNTRIHDMHQQFVLNQKCEPSSPDDLNNLTATSKLTEFIQPPNPRTTTTTTINLQTGASTTTTISTPNHRSSFTPVVLKSSSALYNNNNNNTMSSQLIDSNNLIDSKLNLGRLDGVVSTPNRLTKVRVADSKKIAAILLETNPIELQRHLLTVTFQNQVLQQRLEAATKSKIIFLKKIDKAKEDIDDLKFQLEEKNIELEGTRAQLRVLETKTNFSPEHIINRTSRAISPTRETQMRLQSVSTPSMKAMVHLAMDEILQNSSSTESAQDQTEREKCPETPKRKPSKIPLPGTKAYTAPKPPTGRNSNGLSQRSASGPPSNRSLNKSTSSLLGKSESSLIKKESPSLNRSESAQSWRKESSLNNNSRSSSIPVSAKTSPVKPSFSPIPKPKRDSLTSRVRNLDSLSRIQSSNSTNSTTTTSSSNNNFSSPPSNLLQKSNSKKDLSSSFSTTGTINNRSDRNNKTTSVPIRRVSSVSVSRGGNGSNSGSGTNDTHQNEDNGKDNQTMNESSRDLIREYLTKTRIPPPIFQTLPTFNNTNSQYDLTTSQSQVDIAYKHPILLIDSQDEENHPINHEINSIERDSTTNHEINNEKDNEIEIKYDNLQVKEKNENEESSFITPTPKKNAFSSLTSIKNKKNTEEETQCRLIGKVNPNLIKTWEQLNASTNNRNSDERTNFSISNSENSEQQSCVLFYRKPFSFKDEKEENQFQVNKVVHSESSGDFYDSIDDPSIIENTYVVEDIMGSMYHDSEFAGGEGMAECDSLDKKKICWSIENDNLIIKG